LAKSQDEGREQKSRILVKKTVLKKRRMVAGLRVFEASAVLGSRCGEPRSGF